MPEFQPRWDQSEATKNALIARVAALPEEAQNRRPNAKSFTPLEMLVHMILTERMYIAMATRDGKKARPHFPYGFVKWAMNNARRVPTMKQLEPTGPFKIDEVRAEWNAQRAQMRPDMEDPAVTYKHPLFGRLNGFHLLDLCDAHCAYHQKLFPE